MQPADRRVPRSRRRRAAGPGAGLEPLDTHVQRELLEVCLRRGRRTEATRRFRALRVRTMRELGQGPGFDLADLAGEVGTEPERLWQSG